MKIIVAIIPTDLVTNSLLSFLTNQKQQSGSKEVGSLVTRNISVFCLWRVALFFKAMPNSIDFYKGIFFFVFFLFHARTNNSFLSAFLHKSKAFTQTQISFNYSTKKFLFIALPKVFYM